MALNLVATLWRDPTTDDTFIELKEQGKHRTTVLIDRTFLGNGDRQDFGAFWAYHKEHYGLLFDYIKHEGRNIKISFDIAKQTIKYLMETN